MYSVFFITLFYPNFIIFAKKKIAMIFRSYSQKDTSILKGFAILLICLHNFFHHLAPSTGENEFYFSINHINNFFNQIQQTPNEFINTIFSFLGHYGVQIFIFVSGYGLTLSMTKHHKSWLNFIIDRLKKIYPLLLAGVIFFILTTILMHDRLPWGVHFEELSYKLLFIHTLMPNQGTSVNGPWWFFGLILQLYLLFPFLYHFIKKYNTKAFITICIFAYTWIYLSIYQFNNIHEVYLLQNFPGHLPEFCLGMLLAFNKDTKINNLLFFISLTIFCLGNFYKIFFPFTFLAITIIFIFAYQFIKNIPIKKTLLKNFLAHFGNISLALFAIHGFLREPFIILANNTYNTAIGHIYAALLFMLTAYLMSYACLYLYELLSSIFNKIKLPKENKTTKIISRVLQILLLLFTIYIPYYYISQSNFSNAKDIVKQEYISENFIVEKESVYNTFANIKLNKRYKIIKIEGSVDIKNLDPNTKIPPIVVEINGVLWDKIDINKKYNNNFNTFNFKYNYYAPFIVNLKNKNVKLYFWNTSKSNIEVDNVKISILTN